MDTKQRTILLLMADTGAGHRSAANAIRNAISLISQQEQAAWLARNLDETSATTEPPSTYRIEIVDAFEDYGRFPLREAMKLYGPTIRHHPRLYGEVFHRSNQEKTVLAIETVASPLLFNGLLRLFQTIKPDIIVSVHPMLNSISLRVLRELGLNIPFITVVTDLVSMHCCWFAPEAQAYVVPTEQAKQRCLQHGLDPSRVHVLGMPIDPKFAVPVESKAMLQQKLGLRPDLPTVLLVGGADGVGGLRSAVRAISQARLPVQLLIVTGRNKRLYNSLQRKRAKWQIPTQIFGFVQNMPDFMHAADVIITKAGSLTISEALACHLPIILSGYVPGQEEGNIDYIVESGVGLYARDAVFLVDSLRKLLNPNSPELAQFRGNAQRISRPRASFAIAEHLLSFLPKPGEPSIWASWNGQNRRLRMIRRLRAAIHFRPLPLSLPIFRRPLVPRFSLLHSRKKVLSRLPRSIDQNHPRS